MNCKIVLAFACCISLASCGFGGMGMGMMGGSFKSMGMMNKQLGMSQGLIGMQSKAAKTEVKNALDAFKAMTLLIPEGPCRTDAEATITQIDNELLTAFDQCSMKTEMQGMRVQALSFKQQMSAFKMAKQACKMTLDPMTCMTEASEKMNNDAGQVGSDVGTGMADILTKAGDCVENVKQGLLDRIDAIGSDVESCLRAEE